MKAIAYALRLLPILIRLVEIVEGARQGKAKKEAVLKVFFGLLKMFAPNLDTPEVRELVGELVDEIVASLNEAGVFPKSPAGETPALQK